MSTNTHDTSFVILFLCFQPRLPSIRWKKFTCTLNRKEFGTNLTRLWSWTADVPLEIEGICMTAWLIVTLTKHTGKVYREVRRRALLCDCGRVLLWYVYVYGLA